MQALAPEEIAKRLFQPDVLDRIRISIKNDMGMKVSNGDIASSIAAVLVEESKPANIESLIRKASK